jgi:hypothetical protein
MNQGWGEPPADGAALSADCGGDQGGYRGTMIGCIEAAMLAPMARLVLGAGHG